MAIRRQSCLLASALFAVALGLPMEGFGGAAIPDGVVAISAGMYHSCAITESGLAFCWGRNGSGQLGDGSKAHRATPVAVQGLTAVVAISAGSSHSCAINQAGRAYCWGNNSMGQLGQSENAPSTVPVEVKGLGDLRQISAGAAHSCAVAADGGAWCWGDNKLGQLGSGKRSGTGSGKGSSARPTRVQNLEDVTAISASLLEGHSCALSGNGDGFCWGNNRYGQLGIGSTSPARLPQQIAGLADLTSLTARGYGHSCAAASSGAAWCWGRHAYGQLGTGKNDESSEDGSVNFPTAQPVKALPFARQVAVGSAHSCAIDQHGAPWCWGDNAYGKLGDGTTQQRTAPVKVVKALQKAVAIAPGGRHTCGIDQIGEVYCWGDGRFGQLGNGSTPDQQLTPVKVRFP